MSRVKAGLTHTSGFWPRAGSEIVNESSVATTARSRIISRWRWAPAPESCRNTTRASRSGAGWSSSTTSAPMTSVASESGNPVTQSSRPSASSRSSRVASEPLRAASETATGSPDTGMPWATRESGDAVSRIGRPERSVRPAASLQASTSSGSVARPPVSSWAEPLA